MARRLKRSQFATQKGYKNYRRFTTKNQSKARMGKPFTTRRGRYGCYKYVNGRRVAFVEYNKPRNASFIRNLDRKYRR